MPRVKKAIGKKVDMSKLSENQAWVVAKGKTIHPMEMFSKAAACSGGHPHQATATLAGFSTFFLNELEHKGLFFLPGFGTFTKKVTPRRDGQMKLVFGEWKPVPPREAIVEVVFVPFSQVTEHLCASLQKSAAPVQPKDHQQQSAGAASSSGASGSAGDKPAEHHAAPPSVIIAADKGDDSDSTMGSWSDDGADPAPAPALSSGSDYEASLTQ